MDAISFKHFLVIYRKLNMNPNLKVIDLTKNNLIDAIDKNTYWQNERILMPKSKALWLLGNNRIEPDDYCAFLCLENNNMISYLLIIPDIINLKDGSQKKMNWLFDWWIAENYQGTIVSSYVFNHAIKKLNKNVLMESNAENSETFLSKQFNTIHIKTRYTIFFRLESSVLTNKFSFIKYFKFIIDLLNSTLVKLLNTINFNKTKKSLTPDIHYEYMNEIDNETWTFIEPRCKNDFTLKTKAFINWHIDNSQYTQTPIAKRFYFKYATTGFSDNIHAYTFKIIKDKQIIGFISYLFNMIEFNVKYFLSKDDTHYEHCVDALIEHCLKHKATYIITDDTKLGSAINKKYITLFTYKKEKKSRVHKTIDTALNDVVLTDRDGRFY